MTKSDDRVWLLTDEPRETRRLRVDLTEVWRLGRRRGKPGKAAEADELINSSMQVNEGRRQPQPDRTLQMC